MAVCMRYDRNDMKAGFDHRNRHLAVVFSTALSDVLPNVYCVLFGVSAPATRPIRLPSATAGTLIRQRILGVMTSTLNTINDG